MAQLLDAFGQPLIPFRNDSGESMPAFGVIRPDGWTTIEGKPTLKGKKPNGTFERLWYINGPTEVAANGGFGSCTTLPVNGYASYDSGENPAWNEGYGPKPSSWTLWKGYYGFTIHGDKKTSPHIVLARQGECNCVYVKCDEAIEYHDTGTVSVWARKDQAVGSEADTGFNIENVGNWCVESDKKIVSGDEAWAYWVDNSWRIFSVMTCPETI